MILAFTRIIHGFDSERHLQELKARRKTMPDNKLRYIGRFKLSGHFAAIFKRNVMVQYISNNQILPYGIDYSNIKIS